MQILSIMAGSNVRQMESYRTAYEANLVYVKFVCLQHKSYSIVTNSSL